MDELTSPHGSLALAIAALLVVFGFRLARPAGARAWLAFVAYAAALVLQALGARGLLPGPARDAGTGLRLAGAALLVAGLLLAGKPTRARRRPAAPAAPAVAAEGRLDPVHAGLALVLVGQLLRGPSLAGAIAVLVAVAVNGWLAARRGTGAP
jgi:hypothetical protein